MKITRTYVFMFVPIPSEWIAHVTVAHGFSVGVERKFSDGSQTSSRGRDGESTIARNVTRVRCPVICSGLGSSIIGELQDRS